MAQMTDDEKKAVETWLTSNKPVHYPTGHSAIYDEFGNKMAGRKFRLTALAKRIRQVRGYSEMTYHQIAKRLASNADEVKAACRKHNIVTNDR